MYPVPIIGDGSMMNYYCFSNNEGAAARLGKTGPIGVITRLLHSLLSNLNVSFNLQID